MDGCVSVDELRQHLESAKDRLSLEKTEILNLYPLADTFNREEYAFAYVRAERLGLRAISRRLAEVAWLPMQLDPRAEMLKEGRASMKRWLTAPFTVKPVAENFGNDFIHSLTRCSLEHGGDHANFYKLTSRIAKLFRDLSCLVGLIYYCAWLSENNIDGVGLTDLNDLNGTAEELATLIQSPEMRRHLRAVEQNDERLKDREKAKKPPSLRPVAHASPPAAPGTAGSAPKTKPDLKLIHTETTPPTPQPDPLPA